MSVEGDLECMVYVHERHITLTLTEFNLAVSRPGGCSMFGFLLLSVKVVVIVVCVRTNRSTVCHIAMQFGIRTCKEILVAIATI